MLNGNAEIIRLLTVVEGCEAKMKAAERADQDIQPDVLESLNKAIKNLAACEITTDQDLDAKLRATAIVWRLLKINAASGEMADDAPADEKLTWSVIRDLAERHHQGA